MAMITIAASAAEPVGIKLRAINPKATYSPGDTISLEVKCSGGTQEPVLLNYNSKHGPAFGGDTVMMAPQKCPRGTFEIKIPTDFIGKNLVTATSRINNKLYADIFNFESVSNSKVVGLFLSDWSMKTDECPQMHYFGNSAPAPVYFYTTLENGIREDLCKSSDLEISVDQSNSFTVSKADGHCGIAAKKAGTFHVSASYRGMKKQWVCNVAAVPGIPIPSQ